MNMHINTGDKFIAVKKMWFLDEGTVINITNVSEDGIISFAFGENNTNNGYMDTTTFTEHFKKIEDMIAKVETPTITEEYIAEIMENSEFDVRTVFDKCTVMTCRLPNGFVITEYSACVNPDDYSKNTGTNICYDKIKNKIWELEAYRLQQWLWEEESDICCEDCECCSCEEECDECDECLDTDLDCDDCEDYECPYNSNIRH